jgi:hypothetical protein
LLGSGSTANTVDEIVVTGPGLSLSGTTLAYVPYQGADTRWTTSMNEMNSTEQIYLTNQFGHVGIGTTNPNSNLHMHDSRSNKPVYIAFTNYNSSTYGGSSVGIDSSGNLQLSNFENLPIIFYTNNIERLRINKDGNVGIGTTNTNNFNLNVNGTVNCTSMTVSGLTADKLLLTDANKQLTSSSQLAVSLGGTGKTSITANSLLGCITANKVDEISLGYGLSLDTSGSSYTLNATDTKWSMITDNVYLTNQRGNVGIGTSSPLEELHLHKATTAKVRFTNDNILTAEVPATTSDGSTVGIDSFGNLEIRNYENLAVLFYTNDTENIRIQDRKSVV